MELPAAVSPPPGNPDGRFRTEMLAYLASLHREDLLETGRPFLPPSDASPIQRAATDRLNAVIARLDGDLHRIASLTHELTTKAASNSYLLSRIVSNADEQARGIEMLASALEQTSAGAQAIAASTERTRTLADDLRARREASFAAVGRALDHLGELITTSAQSVAAMEAVAQTNTVIGGLADVIDEISAATTLLGINAAIEAAHARDAGRGFGVVAAEIKRLADSTSTSAQRIADALAQVEQTVVQAADAAQRNARHAEGVSDEAGHVRGGLGEMSAVTDAMSEHITAIATTVNEQSQAFQQATMTVRRLSDDARQGALDATHASEFVLDDLSAAIDGILSGYRSDTYIDRVRTMTIAAAQEVETVIEAAIDAGTLTAQDAFDTDYVPISPQEAHRLAHLFDVSRLGPQGFDPPKYRTRYDRVLDDAFRAIVDDPRWEFAGREFVLIADINSWTPMHIARFRQPITGDPERDLANNRVKRFFDERGVLLARIGLAGAERVAKRAPRSAFRNAGIDLRRKPGRRAATLRAVARDFGVVAMIMVAAIYVRDEHWGVLEIAFDPANVVVT